MDRGEDKPLRATTKRPTRKRKQRITQKGEGGRRKCKKGNFVPQQKCQPSLTWLLPGAARAQRRPLPRPTKPPPPGITPQRRYNEVLPFHPALAQALVHTRTSLGRSFFAGLTNGCGPLGVYCCTVISSLGLAFGGDCAREGTKGRSSS